MVTINMEEEQKKFVDWDFKKSDTKQFTHVIHTYPAMMIPQIARRLIYLYGSKAKTLLDPFVGSGTSLVEASLVPHIKNAYGFDLNPLAVLISKVKTTPINPKKLKEELPKLMKTKEIKKLPEFKNIDYWFKKDVIGNLAILKSNIEEIQNTDVKDFFLAAFSETVRNVSNTRSGEFKLYRRDSEKLKNHNPDVFKEFNKISKKNIKGMEEYVKKRTKLKPKINYFNSMKKLPLKEGSVDIIVTSPPYGDSKTTVAYGQFSRLSLQWLEYDGIMNLDNKLLGGKASKDLKIKVKSKTLKEIVKKIANKDPKRAREVLSFYEDFDKTVIHLNKAMAKDGFVCFVVGNRTVKGINIPTDKIMTEIFMSHGNYDYITTYTRNIPNKRMPKLNSPTNKTGVKSKTMNNEFIFVLKKN